MDPFAKIIHDRIEETPLAKALVSGQISSAMYREYLRNSLTVWEALEQKFELARTLGVAERLREDLKRTPPDLYEDESVSWKAECQAKIANEHDLYVLGLGLCYGGRDMARNMAKHSRLPASHFKMPNGAVHQLRKIQTTSSGLTCAFQKTLAWYNDVA